MHNTRKRQSVNAKRFQRTRERIQRELNPCPGRTDTERQFISRRLLDIAETLDRHWLEIENGPHAHPHWLPTANITPTSEQLYVESREQWEASERSDSGYIMCMYRQQQRATNRVRVASWYRNADQQLYMMPMIMVSPLPCPEWGALPLTLKQWEIIIAAMINTHMHWKWVHAVRQYWNDSSYEVGNSFGWYMEPCKQLTKDDSLLWTGQAIYQHAVKAYSDHLLEILDS